MAWISAVLPRGEPRIRQDRLQTPGDPDLPELDPPFNTIT